MRRRVGRPTLEGEKKEKRSCMEQSIFPYIWRHSRREQLTVLIIVLLSLPFYFMSLSLPKTIVNEAIEGKSFQHAEDTAPALKISVPFPEAWSNGTGTLVLFDGFELQQVDYLFAMSFLFLGLVCINGLFKFQVNTMKGRMASACCGVCVMNWSIVCCASTRPSFGG